MSEQSVIIIDYGMGNVASVANMLRRVGTDSVISNDPLAIRRGKRIVLPGVGAFDAGIEALRRQDLDSALKDAVASSSYVLGICLGAQLLFRESEEGRSSGLELLSGRVRRFQLEEQGLRVPHMGWNVVSPRQAATLFHSAHGEQRFYFAHSFYMQCANADDVAAHCDYGGKFACVVEHERVFGVQFHPEKSHSFGLDLFKRFSDLPC